MSVCQTDLLLYKHLSQDRYVFVLVLALFRHILTHFVCIIYSATKWVYMASDQMRMRCVK